MFNIDESIHSLWADDSAPYFDVPFSTYYESDAYDLEMEYESEKAQTLLEEFLMRKSATLGHIEHLIDNYYVVDNYLYLEIEHNADNTYIRFRRVFAKEALEYQAEQLEIRRALNAKYDEEGLPF